MIEKLKLTIVTLKKSQDIISPPMSLKQTKQPVNDKE